nr:immunoglobulin heavy chain junction region [Macaca mulatta]
CAREGGVATVSTPGRLDVW